MNLLISDIKERETTAPKAPTLKSSSTGFPEHKKRTRVSAFRQKRQNAELEQSWPKIPAPSPKESPAITSPDAQQARPPSGNSKTNERENIDRENNQKLASMSQEEIEDAQHELLGGLDPSVLQMLLRRANIDESSGPSPFDQPKPNSEEQSTKTDKAQEPLEIRIEDTSAPQKSSEPSNPPPSQPQAESTESNQSRRVRWATVEDEEDAEKPETSAPKTEKTAPPEAATQTHPHNDDAAPAVPPPEYIVPPGDSSSTTTKPHWPQPPSAGQDLDPADPDFLSKLHDKYFATLPADPSRLAWMAPLPSDGSAADRESPYHPSHSSVPLSHLRFDFRGALVPPRIARAVPASRGLHHHGEAPEAAGYTVRELARLCRSAVPGQRCLAYQTLGRVLYRLGRGDFGGGAGPGIGGVRDDELAFGVWREVEEGAVLRSLYDEAAAEEGRGHRSARAFAVEAVWLYEKGGWKDRLRKARTTDLK
ncbi:hypothetical protein GGR52DRAFT_578367 [Hypoxylon sp. FL1284]|nr:hypothetical protein GGR52DRAFT_578367 [Hypoxylon sp. FL1284]